ncbi:MAG: PAS domain S-box protein [Thermoanaerobaculia bacterium]|nr:PAS domain S-box protein [Thermoanaerobaculia bacterium]MBP9822654.1 PAS domain S-box protein [Thermoanaerobaculia bacterium]
MVATPSTRSSRLRRALLAALAAVWLLGGTVFIFQLELRESASEEGDAGFALRLGALLLQLLIAVSATAMLVWTRARRNAERAENQRAEEFRQLFHDASEAMFVVDNEFVMVEVNAAACRLIGVTRAEVLGRPLTQLVEAEELATRPMHIAELQAGEKVVSERTLLRKDGTRIIAEVAIQQLPDGRFLGLARDVSQRRTLEQRLRLLSRAVDESPSAMVITDPAGRIEYVNPSFSRITGWSLAEAVGNTPAILKSGQTSPATYRELWEAIRAGREWQGELINRRRNGEYFPWLLSVHPILGEDGGVEYFLGVGEDVTQSRAAERALAETRTELYQAQRMEALGRLAGGVAHDFNNLLGIILGYSDLLGSTLDEGSEGREQLAEIRKATVRAADLTRQLLAFSRRQVLAVRVVDVAALLEDSRKMLERLLPESIELRLDVAPGVWSVRADSTQLVQVLINLAVNARDAMPLGGRLAIAAGNADLAEEEAAGKGLSAGGYVCLTVRDSGQGMTPDVVEQAFEPFFTTKAATGGTGLGLATVYGIVQQLKGCVEIESSPAHGTTLTLYLPRSERDSSGAAAAHSAAADRKVQGTILVVEDLAPLRRLVEVMLTRIGYRVFTAASAREALALSGEGGLEFDLLLSDIVMPGMDGRDLARLMRSARPKLRVVLMTGYADLLADSSDLQELGADAIVQKPFARAQIERVLADVLAMPEEDGKVS